MGIPSTFKIGILKVQDYGIFELSPMCTDVANILQQGADDLAVKVFKNSQTQKVTDYYISLKTFLHSLK